MSEQVKKTREEIAEIIEEIQFLDRKFILLDKGDGFLLQLSYMEEDIETGEMAEQKSRKHYISPYMTETEIVDTAFYAVMRSQEHVTREHFTYRGFLVQSPHFHVRGRVELCARGRYDGRVPLALGAESGRVKA